MAHRMPSLRTRIEKEAGADFGEVLVSRLKTGATIPQLADEWGCTAQHIYLLARLSGLATYWVKDGTEIVARVP